MGNSTSNSTSNRECLTWAKEYKINSNTTLEDVHRHCIQAPDCVGFGNYAPSNEQYALSDVFPSDDNKTYPGYDDRRLKIPYSCIRLSDVLLSSNSKAAGCNPKPGISNYPEGQSEGATDYPFKLKLSDSSKDIEIGFYANMDAHQLFHPDTNHMYCNFYSHGFKAADGTLYGCQYDEEESQSPNWPDECPNYGTNDYENCIMMCDDDQKCTFVDLIATTAAPKVEEGEAAPKTEDNISQYRGFVCKSSDSKIGCIKKRSQGVKGGKCNCKDGFTGDICQYTCPNDCPDSCIFEDDMVQCA